MGAEISERKKKILQIVVSKGPNLVEMPDIIGFTQANASKQLDERGIQYKMQIVENDGTMAEGCVAKTDVLAGTRFDAGKTVVSVFIAGERDDTLVAETGGTGSEAQSAAEPATDPAPPAESEG